MVNQYILNVQHDTGVVTIRTAATSERWARQIVMNAEGCPAQAILSCKTYKS